MIKRILEYNNEADRKILRQISEPVNEITDDIKTLIQDLKDTLHSVGNAKGISAIQIGIPKQICICAWAGEEYVMINPIITRSRGNQLFVEGCLSVPGIYKEIPRAQKVWCTFTNESGDTQEVAEGGRMSNIIQHEIDHFSGSCKIYDDRGF